MTNRQIFDYLTRCGMTPEGACGLMGNFMAESGLRANNVEDRSCIDDATYTEQVDAGLRENFYADSFGYGFAQWTDPSRKAALLKFAREKGCSIGDPMMQLQFCVNELQSKFTMVMLTLWTSHDIDECADRVCDQYERPAINNYPERRRFARQIYDEFRGSGALAAEHQAMVQEEQPAATAHSFFDWKIKVLQFVMQHDGYWGQPDGIKTAEFVAALKQYAADIERC